MIIGGMIADRTVKFTRNNKAMAFITLEDLTGTVEVIIFPKDYERYQRYLTEDAKIFVKGRTSIEDEQDGKLICEKIVGFEETKKELWLQFESKEKYLEREEQINQLLRQSDGNDEVVIYIAEPRAIKRLGRNMTVNAQEPLLGTLLQALGEENVKVVEKGINM